jgi:phosphate transport system permease protein
VFFQRTNNNTLNHQAAPAHDGARQSLPLPGRDALSIRKARRWGEHLAEHSIRGIAFLSFAVIILIFVFVFRETLPIFFPHSQKQHTSTAEVQQETYGEEAGATTSSTIEQGKSGSTSLESGGSEGHATVSNLAGSEWQPVSTHPKYGLLPLIVGSFKVTLVAVAIGAPLAILAALFTSFFAPRWLKEFLKPSIEFLSGFPSVVIGFFALVELATLFQNIFGYQYRLNAFVGGCALALTAIPIIYSVTEDALSSVPKFMTEASLALGATRWQTALFVVLPAATPGVFAALLLGVGRAFGETMVVLMATGNAALMSVSFFQPVRTMSAAIGAEMAEVVFGDTHYSVLFLIGSILFVFTFALNAVAEFTIRTRLQRRFTGTS